MKNEPKRACENLRSEKSCFEKLNSFWFKTSAQTLNLARAIFSCEKNLLSPKDYVLEGKKMVKQKINCLRILTGILMLLVLMPQIFAADPGHIAGAISTGMFESGNYTFPDSLEILKILNVSDGLLYVDPTTNNVGIGTAGPGGKLHVAADSSAAILITNAAGTGNQLKISGNNAVDTTYPSIRSDGSGLILNANSGGTLYLNYDTNGPIVLHASTTSVDAALTVAGQITTTTNQIYGFKAQGGGAGAFYFGSTNANSPDGVFSNNAGIERMRIMDGGNVGIGTTVPAYTLQVEGTTNTTGLRVEGLSDFLANVSISDNLTVGGDKFYVDSSSGNVGIGTTSPGFKLDVYGDINATGVFTNVTSCVNGLVTAADGSLVCSGSVFGSGMDYTNIALLNETLLNDTYFRLVDDGTVFNATFLKISDNNDVAYGPANIAFLNETVLNTTYARLNDANTFTELNHFSANVSMADNLTVTGAGGDALYVDSSSGRVGIGTTSPTAKLSVIGAIETGDTTPTAGEIRIFEGSGGTNDIMNISGVGDNSFLTDMDGTSNVGTWEVRDFNFYINGGNVGIGTTSPGAKLEVINASAYEGLLLNITNGATDFVYNATTGFVGIGTNAPGISTAAGRNYLTIKGSTQGGVLELTSAAADATGLNLGALQWTDSSSTATVEKRIAAIAGVTSGATANNRGGYLGFYTKADGTDVGIPERMRITSDGYVGVNITAPTHAFSVVGTMNVTRAAGAAGGIEVDSTGNVIIRLG